MLDGEDLDRVRRAIAQADVLKLRELVALRLPPGTRDWRIVRDLSRADPLAFSGEDHEEIQRLMWKYRRRLPRELAPGMDPDDPLVRAAIMEQEVQDGLR